MPRLRYIDEAEKTARDREMIEFGPTDRRA